MQALPGMIGTVAGTALRGAAGLAGTALGRTLPAVVGGVSRALPPIIGSVANAVPAFGQFALGALQRQQPQQNNPFDTETQRLLREFIRALRQQQGL
ncbi:MAG: hypothetical protein QW318_06275 [Candidatus Caldarchaeum sp.]